ncbi:MAG: asparagine synthase-related protein, partial [Chloroflexota bacterium]|nr:asparagine synthase-related protein [Chloroflexota bacterium]
LGLPGEQRLRDGLTRSILRRAMGDLLPDAIARRGDKTDFTPAFLHAMRAYDLPVMDAIFAEMGRAAAYVDVRAVQATYRRWRAGGRLLPGHMVALVRIARLVLWLEAKGVES